MTYEAVTTEAERKTIEAEIQAYCDFNAEYNLTTLFMSPEQRYEKAQAGDADYKHSEEAVALAKEILSRLGLEELPDEDIYDHLCGLAQG